MRKIVFGALLFACAQISVAGTYWIDVRSAGEYANGHHPEAVNIPHTEILERISEVTAEKSADIRVYCRSGRRSGIARAALFNHGFTNVTNEGGYAGVMKKVKAQAAPKKDDTAKPIK